MASVMPRRGRGRQASCLSTPAPAVLAMSALAVASLVGCGGDDAVTVGPPGAQPPAVSGTSGPVGSGSGNAQAGSAAGGSAVPSSTPSDPAPPATRTSTRNPGAGTSGATGTGAPVPWETGGAGGQTLPADLPSAASGPAKLSILLDDGSGARSTWTLTCEPVGGTHPEPADACGVLGARGATAFPAPPADAICTEQYGGPQLAQITGTWRGSAVSARLSLENGCQITRWTALLGLLPPGGVT